MRLFCCSYGCVKTSAFSQTLPQPVDLQKVMVSSSGSVVLHLVHNYGLSLGEMESALDVQRSLTVKLQPRIVSDVSNILCRSLTTATLSSTCSAPLQKRDRSPVAEFFDDHHTFCRKEAKMFHVPSVEEILQLCQRIASKRRRACSDSAGCASSSLDVSTCWRPHIVDSEELKLPLILVGMLRTNLLTGRLQLVDQTGEIDCLAACRSSAENQPDVHRCVSADCFTSSSDAAGSRCSYLQTTSLDRLYRIDRFQLVTEVFTGPELCTVVRKYLQFSMVDAVPMSGGPCRSSLTSTKYKSPLDPILGLNPADITEMAAGFQSVDSESLSPDAGLANLSDYSLPGFAPSTGWMYPVRERAKTQCTCSVYRVFVLDYCEPIMLKSRIPSQMTLCFTASGCFIGQPRLVQCGCSSIDATPKACRLAPLTRVSILFQGHSLRWHPILRTGCVYRIVKQFCRDPHALEGNSGFQGCPKPGGTDMADRRLLSLGGDVDVECLTMQWLMEGDVLSVEEQDSLVDFVDEVRHRYEISSLVWQTVDQPPVREAGTGTTISRDLVSVTGIVIARSFGRPQNAVLPKWKADDALERLGMSMPVDIPVLLTVRDISSAARIDVYIDLDRIQYPLGLFVGAVVRLERLDRKVSQKNRCYCRYLVISSCTVLSLAPSCVDQTSAAGETCGNRADLSSCSSVYLADLWKISMNSETTFIISGHVSLVFRVLLKFDRTTSIETFTAHSSFVIDDGTSSSFVNCSGDQVAELLDLDQSQWSALKDLVRPVGEVLYCMQMRVDRSAPIDSFLHELCDSSIVKRHVTIAVRRYRTLLNGVGEKSSDIANWRLSDFERKSLRKGSLTVDTVVLPSLQLEYVATVRTQQ